MRILNMLNFRGKSISRGMSPKNAAMLQIPLDFTDDTTLSVSVNLSPSIQNTSGIAGIQSVKVDNKDNSDVLILTFSNQEVIVCPSYAQGIFPVIFDGELLQFTAYTSTGAAALTPVVTFLNTREQAQLWAAKLPIAGTINVTGSTVYTEKSNDTWANHSAAIAVANTPQVIMPANSVRKTFSIRNPGTAASQNIAAPEPLYVSFTTGLAPAELGTWELFPGESTPLFDLVSTEAIYVSAATAGHRVTALEM